LVPTDVTVAMITTAIKAAMRPYSMAVTPELSFKKHRTSLLIEISISVEYTREFYTPANLSGDLNHYVNFY